MSSKPKICVLVPAYNEEQVIEGTIVALHNAGFSYSDIYIADDRSTDNTADVAYRAGADVYTTSENGGKARAQVAAIKFFELTDRYEWVVFLDADTKVDAEFLNVMNQAVEKEPTVSLFVGQVTSAKNNHIYSAWRAYEYSFFQEISKKGQDNCGVVFVAPGCASLYRADVLKTLNIDSSTLAEDMDLTLQVHHNGGSVRYVHDAIVVTQDPNNLHDYMKQVSRWYRGFWQIVKKHKIFSLTKKKRVDWFMMYVAADSLVFNRFFVLAACLLMFTPKVVGIGMLFDFGVFTLIGIFAAFQSKRLDVVTKLPLFYWLSFLNLYAFLQGFVEVVVFRKEILVWNKVKRYSFDSLTT